MVRAATIGRSGCGPSATAGRPARSRLAVSALLKPAEGVAASWKQTPDEVLLRVPVDEGVRGRDVAFEVHPSRLSLKVGGAPLLEGSLSDAGAIKVDECYWTLEDEGGRHVAICLAKAEMGFDSWSQLLASDLPDTTVTHRVLLELQVGPKRAGLVLGLYGRAAPRTVENFRALVTGERGLGKAGKPLHFKGSPLHRIIPGFMAQGGDITLGNGMGGESIYGDAFEDETFKLKHSARGVLAMANAGPGTNNSQFYITFTATPHLDGKHVVFGSVLAGWESLVLLEGAGSDSGTPSSPVSISDCRLLGEAEDAESALLSLAEGDDGELQALFSEAAAAGQAASDKAAAAAAAAQAQAKQQAAAQDQAAEAAASGQS